MACEQNQIPEEWIQSEKVDDTVDDLYGDQPTTIHAAQTCGFRSGIIQSVQTKTSSVFFSTGPEQYLQVQKSAHHGFQQNPSSYIHPMTGHQFGQQSPYQSGQFYSQYSIQAPPSRRIKVSCLPQGIKPDALKMFFETVVLDGTYIKHLCFNPDSSATIIEFNDPSVTDRVLLRSPLTLEGKQLIIEPYTESDENEKQFDNTSENDDIPKTTVEVTGFSKDLTKDILEMYFECQKRSGGGPIRNIELKEEACLITFQTEAATSTVLKRSHKLSEIKLDVKLYVPPKSAAVYEDRMLITGPHEKITGDFLTMFLDYVGGVLPKEILFSEEDEEKALVIFEKPLDLKRLIENCRMKKQQGARLAFSLVPISRCILVTNIALNISQEMVMMYFETTKRSGGGPVEKVEMLEEGACLVYFEDDSAIDLVISRHHKLGNSQLQVQLFYPCIGRTTSAENSRKFQNPEPVDYKVNLYICLFLKQMPNVKAWVEQEMITVHGRLIVPSENSDTLTVVCTLTSEMEGVKRLVKIWKANAVQKLEECIKQMNCMEYEVVPDIWDSTLLALEKMKITDENKVAVFTDKKYNIIRVVGFKDMVNQTSHNLKRIIDDEKKELEMKKQRTFYRKNLSKQEIYFLSSVNFPDNVHKRYSNVKCTIQQEDTIVFEGTFTDIKQAESFMDETLKSITKASLPNYSRNKLRLLSMKETDKYVRNKLEERNCLGIWEVDDECLIVWDISDGKVNDSVQIIKNCLVEKSLQITSEQKLILNSDVCTLKLAEVRRQYHGYLIINEDALSGTIEITTTDQYAGEIIDIVQDFLQVNVLCSKAIEVDPCKVRYIRQWKNLDINNRLKGVLYKKKIFDLPGTCKYICSEDGEKLIKQIEEENKCTINKIVQENKISQTTAGEEYKMHPVEQLSCRMPGGPTIFVIHGDITDLDIELLVIGCNKALDHSAGLAERVVEKGGNVIQRECLQKTDHPLREGDVVYISGGKLKCKIVAHAISPIWHGGTENEENLLKQVIIKSLDETDFKNFTSIGIPAIGTEIFGYPVPDASHIIVKTLKQYFETKKSTSVKNVFLFDLNIQHVNAFVEAVKMLFPPAVLTFNQDACQAGADVSVENKSGRYGTSSFYSSPRITVVKGELAHQKRQSYFYGQTASDTVMTMLPLWNDSSPDQD